MARSNGASTRIRAAIALSLLLLAAGAALYLWAWQGMHDLLTYEAAPAAAQGAALAEYGRRLEASRIALAMVGTGLALAFATAATRVVLARRRERGAEADPPS